FGPGEVARYVHVVRKGERAGCIEPAEVAWREHRSKSRGVDCDGRPEGDLPFRHYDPHALLARVCADPEPSPQGADERVGGVHREWLRGVVRHLEVRLAVDIDVARRGAIVARDAELRVHA